MRYVLAALCLFAAGSAQAGQAEVVHVMATPGAAGWRFEVLVLHADRGWDHYVDKWQIAAPDGTVLADQVVASPQDARHRHRHAMNRVQIPDDVAVVVVSAHDVVDGWGHGFPYTLPQP